MFDERLTERYNPKWLDNSNPFKTDFPAEDGEYFVLYIDELGNGFDICNPVMISEDGKYKIAKCKFINGVWELKAMIIAWKEIDE